MWQQFRRRRVTRTVLLYLAFAFLLMEAALTATGFVEFPPWGFRAVVGGVVLGFPFVVVLAWTYDVTPKGIVKTPEDIGPEPPPLGGARFGWVLGLVGAVLAGVILRLLRS
jgi:hypothetical protein